VRRAQSWGEAITTITSRITAAAPFSRIHDGQHKEIDRNRSDRGTRAAGYRDEQIARDLMGRRRWRDNTNDVAEDEGIKELLVAWPRQRGWRSLS
jgi:hypothetical protein